MPRRMTRMHRIFNYFPCLYIFPSVFYLPLYAVYACVCTTSHNMSVYRLMIPFPCARPVRSPEKHGERAYHRGRGMSACMAWHASVSPHVDALRLGEYRTLHCPAFLSLSLLVRVRATPPEDALQTSSSRHHLRAHLSATSRPFVFVSSFKTGPSFVLLRWTLIYGKRGCHAPAVSMARTQGLLWEPTALRARQ